MKRRNFIGLIASAAVWPLAVRAQQSSIPVVGVIGARSQSSDAGMVAAVRGGLAETGFVEGKNLGFELRWAEGDYGRYAALAQSLTDVHPAVILATGTVDAARAARNAMPTTPIVFVIGADPVAAGLVKNLNRPGDNLTGFSTNASGLLGKQMELLCECIPRDSEVVALLNGANTQSITLRTELQASAIRLGRKLTFASASTDADLQVAFQKFHQQQVGGVIVAIDAYFTERLQQIADLAAKNAVPAIYSPPFAQSGGLMSYGTNRTEIYRSVGIYIGRILKGEHAGDLPVQMPSKFQLVVNLRAARALGLVIPESSLLRADEVIE